MQSTLENYQKIYNMLEDDQSKYVYLGRLNYLISGDFRFIREITPKHLHYIASNGDGNCITEILSSIPRDAQIVLYGAGGYPKKCFAQWENDSRIISFCSNNKEKQEIGYLGYPVMSPDELLSQDEYFVIISTIQPGPIKEIMGILEKANYPSDKIFLISDRQEDENQYFPEDIIEFNDDEVFIDAGCYKLETYLEFRERCPSLKKIYAFEPDPENYRVCEKKKKLKNFVEADIFPFGTWSHKDTLYFDAQGTAGSGIVDTKTSLSINTVAIDELVFQKEIPKVTFIKMDVEGAELESLKGAQKVIQRDKPKLAICIYHKPEDMVEIPLYIKELIPEYKLYIRHHSNYIFETVLYAIP